MYQDDKFPTSPSNEPLRLVVIGNGMAPGRMLEHLLEEAPDRYKITIFNAEPRVNYDRIMLSPVLSGEKDYEQIVIHGDGWYIKHNIMLYKGAQDRRDRPRREDGDVGSWRDRKLRQARDRHGLDADHPAGARQQSRRRSDVPRSRRCERHDARGAIARQSGRHRRRPARPRSRGGAQIARHGCHRPASDADADGAPA